MGIASMDSLVLFMDSEALMGLGEFLTAGEARGMAAMLASGEHVNRALNEVNASRRERARELLSAADLSHENANVAAAVLNGISGAKSVQRETSPVWTMPGNEAEVGYLTSQFHSLVQGARQSVTCATYNFEQSSKMWDVLKEASERPGVRVVVYVDASKADGDKIKKQMPKATIYRSGTLPSGKQVVSHAKFVVIDHSLLLLTSANFSYSAENRNVEFGVRISDPGLAESVEEVMATKHGVLYELVTL
jgi:phosphatidylserine/phosphatidylglycerophosphate/cardiolipin synthase-like enzyme